MQTRDDAGNTLSTTELDPDPLVAEAQIRAGLNLPNVSHVVVGKLPNRGDIFIMNGLHYVVKFVDYKRGEVRVKMFVPEKRF
jgi:hypothetical protein